MKRLTRRLKANFFRALSRSLVDPPSTGANATPEKVANDDYIIESSFDEEDFDQIETDGAGTNVLMPDIYGDQFEATAPNLEPFEPESPAADGSSEFNPYDTAVLHKKDGRKKSES